jgi:hypothetical protein
LSVHIQSISSSVYQPTRRASAQAVSAHNKDEAKDTKSKGPPKAGVPHVCAVHGCTLPVDFRVTFDYDHLVFLAAALRRGAHPRQCLLNLLVEEYACVTVVKFPNIDIERVLTPPIRETLKQHPINMKINIDIKSSISASTSESTSKHHHQHQHQHQIINMKMVNLRLLNEIRTSTQQMCEIAFACHGHLTFATIN